MSSTSIALQALVAQYMARVGYRDPVGKAAKMLPTIAIWLLVAAFFGAGLFNAIGATATQDSFVRWGYPRWWCRITGGLEMANAVLIALPASRRIGLVFGAIIIGAALVTVLRHREFSHVAPLSLFVALLVLVAMIA